MSWQIISQKEAALLGLRRQTLGVLAVSLLINVVLAVCLLLKGTSVQTVLIPAGINSATHAMTIEKTQVDRDYLALVARDFFSLALNLTPSNVDFNRKELLRHVHPEGYGALEEALIAQARKIKDLHASQSFAISSMTIDATNLVVVFKGTRSTFIGERQTRREPMTLEMRLTNAAGLLRLLSLKPQL